MSGVFRINGYNQVRRINSRQISATFSPADIGDCLLWYDFSDASTLFTDAGTTPVSSDGDLIYQANDKSGNGYNLAQITKANRPEYKINIQNGLSVVMSDGSANTGLRITGTINIVTGDQSIYAVWSLASVQYAMWYDFDNLKFNYWASLGSNACINGYNILWPVTTGAELIGIRMSGTSTKAYKNGILIIDSSNDWRSPISNSIDARILVRYDGGVYQVPNGSYMCELIIYTKETTAIEHNKLITYLNNKWAIY